MIQWLESLPPNAERFADQLVETHPILWWSNFMGCIQAGLEECDEEAYRIALKFLLDDLKTPFGKIHKRQFLKRFRRQRQLISWEDHRALSAVYERLSKLRYRPQEFDELEKLLAELDSDSSRAAH